MNMRSIAILGAGLAVMSAGAAEKPELNDQRDKISYGIGVNLGQNWIRQGIEPGNIDAALVARGIEDALSGGETAMTQEEIQAVLTAYGEELRAKQQAARNEQGEKNKLEGEKFLAENKTKEGVVTLPSGLQYLVLEEGQGESPKATDKVTVHYTGKLLDGTEFDSSHNRGQPMTRAANALVKGWTEALQKMKTGSKWRLFIPPELAYGAAGAGQNIGPNATLIFDVELISFESTQPKPVTSDIIKVPSREGLERGEQIEIIKPEDIEKHKREAQERQQPEQPE
jgi:FKBP-type peptidyl-prolyl cis-trans isomerase FklB